VGGTYTPKPRKTRPGEHPAGSQAELTANRTQRPDGLQDLSRKIAWNSQDLLSAGRSAGPKRGNEAGNVNCGRQSDDNEN
jgi:hypothetical protein